MPRLFGSLALIFLMGVPADAGPFFRRPFLHRPILPLCKPRSPIATMPSCASLRGEDNVPVLSLQTWEGESTYSQQPPTALEPVPGTGSKLPITPKPIPVPLEKLDPDIAKKIEELLRPTQPKQPVVPIQPVVDDSTSARLSRLSTILEWLLWLAGALGLQSFLGKFGPLVALLGSGLQRLSKPSAPAPTNGQTVNTLSHAGGS